MQSEEEDPELSAIAARVQRVSRAFKVLDEAESIVFDELIRIELIERKD